MPGLAIVLIIDTLTEDLEYYLLAPGVSWYSCDVRYKVFPHYYSCFLKTPDAVP